MNLELAQMYGTPGAEQATQEDTEKVAEAELFCKLAAENGIDLNAMDDAQIAELYESTFKIAQEEEKEEKPKEKAKKEEAEKEEEEKAAAAQAEFAAVQEAQVKVAEADHLGRVMAHAFTQESAAIQKAAAAASEEGTEKEAQGLKNLGEKAMQFGKKGLEAVKANPKKAAGAAGAAGALGAAGYAMNKKSSAIDELAAKSAIEKIAEAGWDTDEGAERLTAVLTLGVGESTKIAQATSTEEAVGIRSLELLETAGYPVEWE